jgi:hypothetical protein
VEDRAQYLHASVPQGNHGGSLSYPTKATLSGTATINWKDVLPSTATPAVDDRGRVYDWRQALPLLMKMISMRLVVIGTVDPTFHTDHAFDAEITTHREVLKDHYETLTNGIQCASKNFTYAWVPKSLQTIPGCNVVCADIYTGISAISTITPDPPRPGFPWSYTDSASCSTLLHTRPAELMNAVNSTAWAVRSKLPLFELKSMIDQLYMFLHPAWDLTQLRHRISSEPAEGLCVDVQWGSAANGTPLQLWPCNGTPAQQWTYDRSTGQLRNGLGTCMDQRWSVNPRTVPGTWACETPQGDPPQITNQAQMWTYDPESRRLMNGLGTTLMASNFTQGSPLWNEGQGMGFLSPSTPQQHQNGDLAWRADQVVPSSSPCTLMAGEGLNAGSSLHSCDGRFALQMLSDGKLVLYQFLTGGFFGGGAVWPLWSNDVGGMNGGAFSVMQADGNFVVYPGPGITATWATNTVGSPGSRLVVQNDGNVVVYDAANVPRWATNTCCR